MAENNLSFKTAFKKFLRPPDNKHPTSNTGAFPKSENSIELGHSDEKKPVLQKSVALKKEPVLQKSVAFQKEPVLQKSVAFQKEPVLQKSVALKKEQVSKPAKKKDEPEMSEEDKALYAEIEAEFASWRLLKLPFLKPSFDKKYADVDVFKHNERIYKSYLNMPQDCKDLIVKDPQLKAMERWHKRKQVEEAISKIYAVETEPKRQNVYFMQKQQMEQIDNSIYRNKQIEQIDNSNYHNNQMEQVDSSNNQNKQVKHIDHKYFLNKHPGGGFLVKKSNDSEKEMETVNKNRKKKNRKRSKEINEEEQDLYQFTIRHSYKNIHSSGDVYSAADANVKAANYIDQPPPTTSYIIDQPPVRMLEVPRISIPAPLPFDEPAWDDDFLF